MKILLFWIKLNTKQALRKEETQIFIGISILMIIVIGFIVLLKIWFS
jgi:hypothetical protein